MPTRYLKPGICDSAHIETLAEFPQAEILYYRLIVTVDDFGRLDARPAVVKSKCFPLRETLAGATVRKWMQQLSDAGLVLLYASDGKDYLQLLRWDNKPRSGKSKYPHAPESACTCIQLHTDAYNRLQIPTLLPGTGTGTGGGDTPPIPPVPCAADASPEPGAKAEIKSNGKGKPEPPTRETWSAYSGAYAFRYGVEPVRNKQVNSQIKQFVARIGIQEAPSVAAFYLSNNSHTYVRAKHSAGLLLHDAEGLRTEWATGRHVTDTDARQADKTHSTKQIFDKLIAESEAASISMKKTDN